MVTATQTNFAVSSAWSELTATVTAAVSSEARIQNRGPGSVQVFFGGASAPAADASGFKLENGETATGNAAKIWVRSASGSTVSVMTGAPGVTIAGDIASGATDSGNPVKVAGVYNSTPPTFTTGQRGDLQLGSRGSLRVELFSQSSANPIVTLTGASDGVAAGSTGFIGYSATLAFNGTTYDRARGDVNGLVVQSSLSSASWAYAGVTGGITDTSDVVIKAAAGGSVRNYLKSLQFKNNAAVASEIVVKDGSTVIWRGHVSASMISTTTIIFDPPLRGTANTAMNVAMITTATATIISGQGFTGV